MSFEERLDTELEKGIQKLLKTKFYLQISKNENVEKLYTEYLKYAYHYVINTSSFTPLAARRMDPKHLRVRKWLLEHSSDEMGHELMALKDLERLGEDKQQILSSSVPVGVKAWTSFFYYKVTQENPFTAFGVLYFLEGMAQKLAPSLLQNIIKDLPGEKKKAITFFKEHGELDADHMQEQRDLLLSLKLTDQEEVSIIETVREAVEIKIFMIDQITKTANS